MATAHVRGTRWWAGAVVAVPLSAWAHAEDEGVQLHVGEAYDSCYVDLHPELTQRQLGAFAREFNDAGAFHALSGARTLQAGQVVVGLSASKALIDDSRPQWNNTFSHPEEDHWLGQPLIPALQGRVGVGAAMEVEAMVTKAPDANWGLLGLGLRRELTPREATVEATARLSTNHLFGPEEVAYHGANGELLLSHGFGWWHPYAGAGLTASYARERTKELDLDPALAWGGRGTVGAEADLGHLRLGAEGTLAAVPSWALVVAGSF